MCTPTYPLQNSNLRPHTDQLAPDVGAPTTRGQEWAATAGDELAKANAALDTPNSEVPPSVVKKWQAALLVAHGEKCVFKRKKNGGNKPNVWTISGWHVYKFVLTGTYPTYPTYPTYGRRPRCPVVFSQSYRDRPAAATVRV